jgi:phosphatidate cytidylyltransferase
VARVTSGLALLATLVLVVWFLPPWATLALALCVAVLATREFFVLARRPGEAAGPGEGPGPGAQWAMVAAVCAVCAAAGLGARLEAPLLAAMVLAGALAVATGHPSQDVTRGVAVLALPVLYLGVPLGVLVLLRAEWGPGALFTAVLGVAASDIAQFYGGKAFGRRKLAPVISPKKTVEGAVSGFLGAAVALPLFGWLWLPGWPAWVLALVGAALAAAGIVGDRS